MPYAKRTVLPGFPSDTYFTTREALDEYFEGDRIVCLLCGHDFRQLEPHLKAVHSMSCDDYRERYGIPYTRGLCSSAKSELCRENMHQYFEENPGERERRAACAIAHQELAKLAKHRNKPLYWKRERTKWEVEDARRFGERVIAGRTIGSVELDEDVPTREHILWMLKRNPELKRWWEACVRPFAPTGLSQADKERNKNKT